MQRIALMQGRLLAPEGGSIQGFPRDRWREEFALAAAAGVDAIEWIYDVHGADVNPLATDAGVAEMRALSGQHGIAVVSLCADYFLERPFVRVGLDSVRDLTAHLIWLIGRCSRAGITRVVLPLVDGARIDTPGDEQRTVEVLRQILPLCAANGVELHLETALAPDAFSLLLAQIPDPLFRVNYDAGNSASLGYDVASELAAYGARIGSVHIKDRVHGGGSVPLGTGDADLPALVSGLGALRYQGDYVLQVARGADGSEVEWARQNRAFLIRELGRIHSGASQPRC
jgi:L-ribulose-5-phosphate 3-epimerase